MTAPPTHCESVCGDFQPEFGNFVGDNIIWVPHTQGESVCGEIKLNPGDFVTVSCSKDSFHNTCSCTVDYADGMVTAPPTPCESVWGEFEPEIGKVFGGNTVCAPHTQGESVCGEQNLTPGEFLVLHIFTVRMYCKTI